jgi:hypothetical protein
MTYELLKFAHLIGLALMAAGLIGVFMCDLRSRQLHDLPLFAVNRCALHGRFRG